MRGAEAFGVVLPLKGVSRVVVAVEDVFDASALERRLVVVHVSICAILEIGMERIKNILRETKK